jgi:hypothetical protein
VGGVWGVEGESKDAVGVVRVSTKGAPRDRGAASWERLRASTSVVELDVGSWEAPWGSLLVAAAAAAVACGCE